MKRNAFGLSVGLLAITLLGSGCGYSTRRPFPSGISTVHVEMLQSREFRRELEFELTEALIKRIEMDTPYRIADAEHADTIFSGEILEVRQNVLGKRFDTGTPREQGAQVAIRYRWKDQRTGKILVERPRFVHQVGYIPAVGESFDKGVRVRGIDQMAERIVETMETDW
ncbi:MAG TPA: LPS assembly lipoprotein LptE [Phycisphaerae bacterium]|nr:LPS assembly lipoprotein LptE [Phycisphaerae bacterium]